MRIILRFLTVLLISTLFISCSTSIKSKIDLTRKLRIKVINVTNLEHKIAFLEYSNKNELLGKTIKDLYSKGKEHLLGVNETLEFETDMIGLAMMFNYNSKNRSYGTRDRWRPGNGRKVEIVFEFRLAKDGYLVQIAENEF